MPAKCTGVFAQQVEPDHPLTDGLGPALVLPHSRLNTVATRQVRAAGYDDPPVSEDAGGAWPPGLVDRSRVVLVQAHPEYGPTTLLREYHRDVRRYVLGDRDELPVLPGTVWRPTTGRPWRSCTDGSPAANGIPTCSRPSPSTRSGARAPWSWETAAIRLYANWLAGVPKRSR